MFLSHASCFCPFTFIILFFFEEEEKVRLGSRGGRGVYPSSFREVHPWMSCQLKASPTEGLRVKMLWRGSGSKGKSQDTFRAPLRYPWATPHFESTHRARRWVGPFPAHPTVWAPAAPHCSCHYTYVKASWLKNNLKVSHYQVKPRRFLVITWFWAVRLAAMRFPTKCPDFPILISVLFLCLCRFRSVSDGNGLIVTFTNMYQSGQAANQGEE